MIETGVNVLVGAETKKILNTYSKFLNFKIEKIKTNLYGKGNASKKIVEELIKS